MSDKYLRLYCAQINPTVGDFKGNYNKIAVHIERAAKNNADIIAFPELALTGYPPEDLVLKPAFIEENLKYISKIKDLSENITAIIGFINRDVAIYNSAAIINNKQIVSVYNKQNLPNYSVFDEERYFQKGNSGSIYEINGVGVGVNICEDIYYSSGPLQYQSILGGAILVINISASPYHAGKVLEREKMLFTRAVDNRVNILYVNLVGGQDELVFDGNSMLVNDRGSILCRAKPFEEDCFIYDINSEDTYLTRFQDAKFKKQRENMSKSCQAPPIIKISSSDSHQNPAKKPEKACDGRTVNICCEEEEIFGALVLGTRDYIRKNGFTSAVLGLSGGIDSALSAVIASFAIGAENITGVLMPSSYSSTASVEDAKHLSKNIGIKTITLSINEIYLSYLKDLKAILKTEDINITKENLQARIRGNILMGLSNEYGWLVIATGNKSEISTGYCTLYGDMVGGFSPLKDIYKTMVYRISNFINSKYGNIIPENIIKKAPSAELKPNQTDQDSLPPYDILDSILKAYIEDEKDFPEIVKLGFDKKTVAKTLKMVDFNEYKRRQGAPGIKITARAFGKDRRYPITNKFEITLI